MQRLRHKTSFLVFMMLHDCCCCSSPSPTMKTDLDQMFEGGAEETLHARLTAGRWRSVAQHVLTPEIINVLVILLIAADQQIAL